MASLLQSLLDGLLIGGVYATIAMGLSLAFGVMRIINWAHGELLMLSMYISFYIIKHTSMDPYLVLLFTGTVMFGIGYICQKVAFNRLLAREATREPISVLLFTSGLGMILSNGVLILFGAMTMQANTSYTGKTIKLSPMIISNAKLISFSIAIAVALALFYILQKTEIGRAIRATSQNRSVAKLMGINESKIYCISFGISIMLVGISGALLMPYFSVYPTVGQVFSFKSFVIVVLGGKGSVLGALLGGLLIGVIEKIGALYFSESYAQLIIFLLFVVILLFKPSGLLSKERE